MTMHTRHLFALLALTMLGLFVPTAPARADNEVSATALKRAHAFLNTADRGKTITNMVHFGATYGGHTYKGYTKVKGRNGKIVPGHMALIFDFKWASDGETRIAFFCDGDGDFYSLKVQESNGNISRPFVLAELSIKLVGKTILDGFKGKIKEKDREDLNKVIDAADPKGLLELSLKVQQALGQ